MKSQQQELSIKTNCKECVFAIYNGKTQVSCEFDRIRKFGEKAIPAYDEEKEFFVIDTLCCYYRDKNKGHSSLDKNKVIEQSSISFDVLINCNEISEINRDATLNLLNHHSYFDTKLNFLLVHEYEKKELVKYHVEYVARNFVGKSNITISICSDLNEFLNEYISKSKRLCHILINDANKVSGDIFIKLNNFVNNDLGKFLIARSGDHLCMSNIAYRMQKSKSNSNSYLKIVEDIIDISKQHELTIEI